VQWIRGLPQGLLAAAYFLAVVSWFMILTTGEHPAGHPRFLDVLLALARARRWHAL
jgi:hypothetical protein